MYIHSHISVLGVQLKVQTLFLGRLSCLCIICLSATSASARQQSIDGGGGPRLQVILCILDIKESIDGGGGRL